MARRDRSLPTVGLLSPLSLLSLLLLLSVGATAALAQDDEQPPPEDPEVGLTGEGEDEAPPVVAQGSGDLTIGAEFDTDVDDSPGSSDTGAFLLAGKLGGGLPFNDLDVGIAGAIEIGYLFSRADPSLGVFLDVSYFVPESDGTNVDPRLATATPNGDGAYSWHAHQKELTLQPTFLYRMTMLSDWIVPYAGIGPRIYLLQTVVNGKAGDSSFPVSKEQSTKFGFGVPLGAEFKLGPGGVIAELLFQWGPLKHDLTGDTHLGSASLWVGYRALL